MKNFDFVKACSDIGIEISQENLDLFKIYKDFLVEKNQEINLTAITDEDGIYEKHFYDCLLSIKYFDYKGTLCDVGSGAGFPGVVLKIVKPELKVTLLEPIKKRCHFLLELIDKLKLEDIEVVNQRAEDYAKSKREYFDIVTARAVKSLDILSELCLPLVKVGGNFIILKGSSGKEEIDKATHALNTLKAERESINECELINGDKRIIAIYKKVKKTDMKYPRNYSLIKKRPL